MSIQLNEQINDNIFTATECNLLRLLNEGKTPDDIALLLGLSRLTVNFYIKNINQKLLISESF